MFQGYLPMILDGLRVTLSVAGVSLAIASLFGMLGATAKLSHSPLLRAVAETYTTVVRSLPDLLLMLIVFYGGQILLNRLTMAQGWPQIDVNAFVAGTLTLGFVFGAYLTETFRGAILAVPRGQIEAGLACGLKRRQVLFDILLPQMVRHAIPGFTNNWLVMLKATALVSIIGLDDMVHRASLASAATREPFTFYALIGAIYLAVTTVSILGLGLVERRFSRGVRQEAVR
ncbi:MULTISPECIES: ABC transporter permease [unclassified Paracoccus (in: a-proteobacteria)]|uniref:ABC transporter permease n=1 Tax=unclassified Paracoccus (in: a-proteobacteria) TaxID=2688777 RepID=UPI0012B28D14|nr:MULTISPECIES: ABC transporter permease [unclassified Paracoccus (in: a-proteobacteria)]UXU76436.1 ABC transporter permease [Paracoccus sp. SMMA_5]UXU82226.1 ABC transporter permease [Paracoccus sp. SMMA_5_TC]